MILGNRHQKFGMTDLSSIGGILLDLDGVLYWRYGFVTGQGLFGVVVLVSMPTATSLEYK